jgi:hypothetical protein
MDISAVALAAASLLAIKAGEGFATDAGKEVWTSLRRIVQRKLSDDTDAQLELEKLESEPISSAQIHAVAQVIRIRLHEDERFRQRLQDLVTQAQQDRSLARIVAQASGKAKQVNIAGSMYGDVEM